MILKIEGFYLFSVLVLVIIANATYHLFLYRTENEQFNKEFLAYLFIPQGIVLLSIPVILIVIMDFWF